MRDENTKNGERDEKHQTGEQDGRGRECGLEGGAGPQPSFGAVGGYAFGERSGFVFIEGNERFHLPDLGLSLKPRPDPIGEAE